MKKAKIAFWVLLIGFFGLVIYQNKPFFFDKYSFHINLYFKEYFTPALPVVVLFAAFFLAGLLIAYFFSLSGRFKANRTIKTLNATLDTQRSEIETMKKQVEGLRNPQAEPVTEKDPAPEP